MRNGEITLDKPGHETLTQATAETLRKAIREGQFKSGEQLPPETQLVDMLSVSRTTVREALRILVEQGLVERRRGLGTFVCDLPIIKDLSVNFGITEMIRQAGFRPGSSFLDIRIETASDEVGRALGLDSGEKVLVLERVRTANDTPVVWSLDYFPEKLYAGSYPDPSDLKAASFYDFVVEQLNLGITHGEAYIQPVLADTAIASKLGVALGAPILLLTQTDFTNGDSPVIYSVEYHLPDQFRFLVHRRGPHW